MADNEELLRDIRDHLDDPEYIKLLRPEIDEAVSRYRAGGEALADILRRPDVFHALEIGRMGRPYSDVQGYLYMAEQYRGHSAAYAAQFTDYGLAHAACVLFNAADDIIRTLASSHAPEQVEDGWIEWKGGNQPVRDGALIYWKLWQNGKGTICGPGHPEGLEWKHGPNGALRFNDIIAYRIAPTSTAGGGGAARLKRDSSYSSAPHQGHR